MSRQIRAFESLTIQGKGNMKGKQFGVVRGGGTGVAELGGNGEREKPNEGEVYDVF